MNGKRTPAQGEQAPEREKSERDQAHFTDAMPDAHPVCLLLPDMTPEEFNSLKADINQHGLQHPVLLHPNGQILDGRHRARACHELGVEARFETWHGTDPVGYVLSTNLFRRHLTASQRAMIAAEAVKLHQAEAEARQKAGKTLAPVDAKGKAAEHAAKAAGVSTRSVERAVTIRQNGTPEDVKDVVDGKATVRGKAQEVKARTYTGRFPESASRIPSPEIDDAEIVDSPPTTQAPRRPAGPPKPTAKDALHRALAVTAALAELDKVADVLDRDDAKRIVEQLEDALIRYRPLAGQEVDNG